MLYYKKCDAVQFKLTDEQKELAKHHKAVFFEGGQVKHLGGNVYIALLQQGENIIRMHEEQWLVKHQDGLWQILWPVDFIKHFVKANMEDKEFVLAKDPFIQKSYNQPTL